MNWMERLALFTPLDLAALSMILILWSLIAWRVEHPSAAKPSVSRIMAGYRQEWMRQMLTREPRIFDAQVLGTLRQGTAFFASTSVIAIGGTLAVIGNAERMFGKIDANADGNISTLELEVSRRQRRSSRD